MPNLAKVIPAMDLIDKHLATSALNQKYNHSIQATLAVGKKLLNKYYDRSDHSEVYRIAMGMFQIIVQSFASKLLFLVLHPSHKLEYFRTAQWEDDWVQAAEEIVHTEFERAYMDVDSNNSCEIQSVRPVALFFSDVLM